VAHGEGSWHECRRWEDKGLDCPFGPDKESVEDDEEDAEGRRPGVPAGDRAGRRTVPRVVAVAVVSAVAKVLQQLMSQRYGGRSWQAQGTKVTFAVAEKLAAESLGKTKVKKKRLRSSVKPMVRIGGSFRGRSKGGAFQTSNQWTGSFW
jgi:hypothetical protein